MFETIQPGFGEVDGKRLRACEKRLELHCKAKPKIGGCQGEAPGRLGAQSGFWWQRGVFSIKNRSKNYQNSTSFFDRFWSVLGPILEPFGRPKSTQDGPSWAQDGS